MLGRPSPGARQMWGQGDGRAGLTSGGGSSHYLFSAALLSSGGWPPGCY